MGLEERGGEERGMLFYAQSRGGLTALATTSVVNGSTPKRRAVGSLNGSIRGPRNRLTAHNVVTVFSVSPEMGKGERVSHESESRIDGAAAPHR